MCEGGEITEASAVFQEMVLGFLLVHHYDTVFQKESELISSSDLSVCSGRDSTYL